MHNVNQAEFPTNLGYAVGLVAQCLIKIAEEDQFITILSSLFKECGEIRSKVFPGAGLGFTTLPEEAFLLCCSGVSTTLVGRFIAYLISGDDGNVAITLA
jgi:hypothetical protein